MTLRLFSPGRRGHRYWFVWGRLGKKMIERSTGCVDQGEALTCLRDWLVFDTPLRLMPPNTYRANKYWIVIADRDGMAVHICTGCFEASAANAWLDRFYGDAPGELYGDAPREPVQLDLFFDVAFGLPPKTRRRQQSRRTEVVILDP